MEDTLTFISSDGHATARMRDYKPYLEKRLHDEFDEFVVEYEAHGSRNFDPPAISRRTDAEVVEEWSTKMAEPGRLEGCWNPEVRLRELNREGIAAEVLFPDFGDPFELYTPSLAKALGYPLRSAEKIEAGNKAFNRWLADFCSIAPERFAPMAELYWKNVEGAVQELHWIKEHGFAGIVLPVFDPDLPLFSEEFEPIWDTLEDLELIVNSHAAISATGEGYVSTVSAPHPGSAFRMWNGRMDYYSRELIAHLIWGGVMERHPKLTFVFTEVGSGWTVGALRDMDYAYTGSYLRRDLHDVITMKPSDYFARQCYLGSSLLSIAEVEHRHEIGVDKMMIGADYPHHEGMFLKGTRTYLQTTLGTAQVPVSEAKAMLSETASRVFGFDIAKLPTFDGDLRPEVILTPPAELVPLRGDLGKPFV